MLRGPGGAEASSVSATAPHVAEDKEARRNEGDGGHGASLLYSAEGRRGGGGCNGRCAARCEVEGDRA